METKLILAKCKKTDKKFCFEVKLENSKWVVKNFLDLKENEYNAITGDKKEGDLYTSATLIKCSSCGSRKIGGCSCARTQKRCKASDKYSFQCAYCDQLDFNTRLEFVNPKIYVTSKHWDDIGQVLKSMNLDYSKFKGKFDCDILFINCGTSDAISSTELEKFVRGGGCVYISDLACSHLNSAFPGIINFETCGNACKTFASAVDAELKQFIQDKIEIEYDLGSWAKIKLGAKFGQHNGKVLLKGAGKDEYKELPFMVSFDYGEGKVFYTSFHNHAQANEKEKMLLQLLLLKQIGSKTSQSIEEIGDLIGLNISGMKERFKK